MNAYVAELQSKANTTVFNTVGKRDENLLYKWLCLMFLALDTTTKYQWGNDPTDVNLFEDVRKYGGRINHDYEIAMAKYEKSAPPWPREKFEKPQYESLILADIEGMTRKWEEKPDLLLYNKMISETDINTKDGVTFFSNSHPIDGTTDVNDNVISGSGILAADIIKDFDSAKGQFQTFRYDPTRYVHPHLSGYAYVLVHAPALAGVMSFVFKQPTGAATNQGARNGENVEPYSWSRLTGNDWYLFIVSDSKKPFIHSRPKMANGQPDMGRYEWANNGKPDFETDKYKFGVSGEMGIDYGEWELAVKVDQ
jgi:phage major head subunit gpT-like protein